MSATRSIAWAAAGAATSAAALVAAPGTYARLRRRAELAGELLATRAAAPGARLASDAEDPRLALRARVAVGAPDAGHAAPGALPGGVGGPREGGGTGGDAARAAVGAARARARQEAAAAVRAFGG
jgi:hypothetical protein